MKKKEIKKTIRLLCEAYEIPTPRIRFKQLKRIDGYFDPDTYTFVLRPDISKGYLRHEIAHYKMILIQKVSQLEEDLCDMIGQGLKKKLKEVKE